MTGGRLHAVRYKLAIDKYIREKGYTDVKALVAFSGEVVDDDFPDKKFTEVSMNGGIRESELPERFNTEEYQVLIVAEKYQTGFDQPLLHTMYVDKRLDGMQAVQTLSRLNRKAQGKDDTFVLDFVNERDDIFKAFKPYYEATEIGEMPDAHQLYGLQHELEASAVIDKAEITQFCEIWYRRRREPTAASTSSSTASSTGPSRGSTSCSTRTRTGSRASSSASATSMGSSRKSSRIRIPISKSSTPTPASCS